MSAGLRGGSSARAETAAQVPAAIVITTNPPRNFRYATVITPPLLNSLVVDSLGRPLQATDDAEVLIGAGIRVGAVECRPRGAVGADHVGQELDSVGDAGLFAAGGQGCARVVDRCAPEQRVGVGRVAR